MRKSKARLNLKTCIPACDCEVLKPTLVKPDDDQPLVQPAVISTDYLTLVKCDLPVIRQWSVRVITEGFPTPDMERPERREGCLRGVRLQVIIFGPQLRPIIANTGSVHLILVSHNIGLCVHRI